MTRFRCLLLLSVVIVATALCSSGEVFISVAIAPPVLPVYAQPICPAPGYLWVPGYWAWSPQGYYWVPGTWALPPDPGLLWTPGYWGFSAGLYTWYPGYWGPVVGFYGGINYGFGYPGAGYYGGYWRGHDFYYNRTVNNVNINNVHYAYNRTVVNNVNVRRVSYNGGPGGIQARATSAQLAAEREHHRAATSAQVQHEQAARNDRAQFASVNHGKPAVVATSRPGGFTANHATQSAVNRREPAPSLARNARSETHPPQQNHEQARVQENMPHPPHNNHPQTQAQENVHRPPTNHEQAHSVPHASPAEHSAPARHPEPPQQARQASRPPRQAAPEYHAAARPPQHMTQRPAPHQAEPPRQMAAHQPPPRGHQEERPR